MYFICNTDVLKMDENSLGKVNCKVVLLVNVVAKTTKLLQPKPNSV